MNVQWYPGHMTKARRQMQDDLSLVDLVIELVDARVPQSSRNPDIDELGKNKARLILLNKADLADENENKKWLSFFREKGFFAVTADSRRNADMKAIQTVVREASAAKRERDLKRGIKNRPVRAMVAGIPNVGKSTFINTFAGKACTRTGNKPGVTRGKQWIRLNKEVELLDTPGILWPKFEDSEVGLRLAATGAIKDDLLQMEELALWLIRFLSDAYPDVLQKRYGIQECLLQNGSDDGKNAAPDRADAEILSAIARQRGCIRRGDELDYNKASLIILDDFRSGRLGRITLDRLDT